MHEQLLEGATKEELEATRELLQRSHDYIETYGFEISWYSPIGEMGTESLLLDGRSEASCCYIGTVRGCAGVDHEPLMDGSAHGEDAGYGNGPELRLALAMIDEASLPELSDSRVAAKVGEYGSGPESVGRFAESFGFQFRGNTGMRDTKAEWREALRIFRCALTEVHHKIEAADA